MGKDIYLLNPEIFMFYSSGTVEKCIFPARTVVFGIPIDEKRTLGNPKVLLELPSGLEPPTSALPRRRSTD